MTYSITNVNVVPMDREVILNNYTIIVEGERIRSMAPTAKLTPLKDSIIIDGTNKYIMPGLADMHVHVFEEDQLSLFIANGVTTVRNMWGIPKNLDWRKRINDGKLLGPRIYTAGNMIDGNPPVFPESEAVTSIDKAREIVLNQKRAGYDFIKVYNNLTIEVYNEVIKTARDVGIPVAGHVPVNVGLDHVLESKQDCIEHLDGYEKVLASTKSESANKNRLTSMILDWIKFDRDKIPEIVRRTSESNTWNCPTLIVYEKWVPLKEVKKIMNRREFKYLSPSELEFHDPEKDNYTKAFASDIFEAVLEGNLIRKELVKTLYKGGARILLGTDCGNPLVVHGFSIHEELQNFVDAGLTPYETIKTGTYDAADFLNALDEFGSIAIGKRADFILLETNPLDDVKNIKNHVGVMVRGKWYSQPILQSKLDDLILKYSVE